MQLESSLRTQKNITSDLEEIIQLDGTSDVPPKAEVEGHKDGEDEEIVGIVDAEDLKVLDEEEEEEVENSTSDNPSLSSTSDTDEQSVDIIEEVKILIQLKMSSSSYWLIRLSGLKSAICFVICFDMCSLLGPEDFRRELVSTILS